MKTFYFSISVIISLLLTAALIYGGYFIVKTVSYKVFYKDMVKETITEMVKSEALK